MTDEQGDLLKGKFLDESYITHLITSDTDAYDSAGRLILRFRKRVMDIDLLKTGVESFKGSIQLTEGRGQAAGEYVFRKRLDGTEGNFKVSPKVYSGNVGFMDPNMISPFCRMTAFGRQHRHLFEQGIPFVQRVSQLYEQLCPEHYAKQRAIADATNRNYVIGDTVFTTITVNKNFRTAVHKDGGDFPEGFGNLTVFRDDSYTGGYFVLPEWGLGVDLHNGDVLFANVHAWHGNTELKVKPGYEEPYRISFVMYYREYMLQCKQPAEELHRVKMDKGGYRTLPNP